MNDVGNEGTNVLNNIRKVEKENSAVRKVYFGLNDMMILCRLLHNQRHSGKNLFNCGSWYV